MPTGFIYSQDFLYHNANSTILHYENSDRLLACLNRLHQSSYFNSLFFPEMKKLPNELKSILKITFKKLKTLKEKEVILIQILLLRKNRGYQPTPQQILE